MKMRELEARTGVNRETIRVYLREGLLPQPQRPRPNVAVYGEEHVRAVRAVRELQHGRRLSLAEIRRALDGDASALPSDAGAFPHLERLVAARLGAAQDLVPLSSVAARNPRAAADAEAFAHVGAVRLVRRKRSVMLSRADAQLIGLWGDMRAAGFDESTGFDASVVEIYVKAARSLAAEEVGRFLAEVTGRVDEEKAAEMARTAVSTMLPFFGLLRMKAVLDEIRRGTGAATPGS